MTAPHGATITHVTLPEGTAAKELSRTAVGVNK